MQPPTVSIGGRTEPRLADLGVTRRSVARFSANAEDSTVDYNSFLTAAMHDDGAAVAAHIASGLSPNFQIPDGQGGTLTILHLVAFKGLWRSTKALLDGAANPDTLDSTGEPPLKLAIAGGHKAIVGLLLDYGASVGIRLPGGDTLLHAALVDRQSAIAQLLVDRGANPDVANHRGITARQLGGFQAMKAGGWDTSKPNTGASLFDNLNGLSEEGLMGVFTLLPLMIKKRLDAGEITGARAATLNDLLNEFRAAMNLPLEIRSTRMKEIAGKLLALGMPQGLV
jgi:hypothetical protein